MTNDGRFIWRELRTADAEADLCFYADLFGWTFERNPAGHTILNDGVPIGGVSAAKPGVPNHWTPFVACPDVDTAAQAARTGGGIVTTGEPADVPGMGRLAPILDPDKSIFVAITPGPALPAPSPRPGAFVWERLRTPGPSAIAPFYADVLGWTPILSDDATGGVFRNPDGTHAAELLQTGPGTAAGWLSFVLVDDLDATTARATTLGATTATPVTIPGIGRFTIITDPKGATLAAHQAA